MKLPKYLMRDEVVVKPYLGNTGTQENFGNEYTQKCQLNMKQKVLKDSMGTQIVAEGTLKTHNSIPIESTISIGSVSFRVTKVEPIKGFGKVISYYEVEFI